VFRTVLLSISRSFSLYTLQWDMSCKQAVSRHVWHIPMLCVQWKTPDDGQRKCPKRVNFHSMDKFEKLVHLVGFIKRNLSRCSVTWTTNFRQVSLQCVSHTNSVSLTPYSVSLTPYSVSLTPYSVSLTPYTSQRFTWQWIMSWKWREWKQSWPNFK